MLKTLVVCLLFIAFAVSSRVNTYGYITHIDSGSSADMPVYAAEAGLYNLVFEYVPLSAFLNPEFSVRINGEYQHPESRRIIAPIIWEYPEGEFLRSRMGHEQLPQPQAIREWTSSYIYHAGFLQTRPLLFELQAGENIVTFTHISGEMLLGAHLAAVVPAAAITYNQYRQLHANLPAPDRQITLEAQYPTRFNSSFIRLVSTNSPDATPYSSRYMLLNTIGGDAWQTSGQSITYTFYVEEAGLYNITLNALQNFAGESTFRTLLINGQLPFAEMEAFAIPSNRRFVNHTLSNYDGVPFYFYFPRGRNEITLVATAAPTAPLIDILSGIRDDIRHLSLDIRRLTGNRVDINRDWQIEEFIPDVRGMFADWVSQLEYVRDYLTALYNADTESTNIVNLNHAIRRLTQLGRSPNDIPFRMSELAEGAASAAVILAGIEASLAEQPLLLNQIIIHGGNAELPQRAGFSRRVQSFFMQFFASLTMRQTRDADALEVWVSHTQQHLELLQHLADTMFTAETGIPVNFSLMPNDTNLILANAGGRAPDIALGISSHLPYQMAIRGAAADLTQFEGFADIAGRFSPGAFLPLMYEEGVFGLPETQDFYVLFYRTDLMEDFGLTPPDTWDDVIGLLPELNRRGVNFFVPMSAPAAHKPFMFTSPFFYQFGADFYSADGLSTAINSPEGIAALTFMTDLFTLYSLPMQVANFYNDFRYGGIPIGISNLSTYIMLTTAAPEIAGAWNIAPHPGRPNEHGEVMRWAAGSAQMTMMLAQSERQDDAFKFMEWWSRTETQTTYANNLILIHGPTFLWSSANLEAFANLPIPPHHLDVILRQWEFLHEVPLTPAAYIVEREVSNIWNRVVFDGDNLRVATDRAVNTINREMRRRMEEFGYIDRGVVVRPYNLPTLERARRLAGG
ncbi:MAG: extracellular solute-binding protein [Firmicutes bacterium]|nr:extracellular solute-binding protein [Bacillota bacterium]